MFVCALHLFAFVSALKKVSAFVVVGALKIVSALLCLTSLHNINWVKLALKNCYHIFWTIICLLSHLLTVETLIGSTSCSTRQRFVVAELVCRSLVQRDIQAYSGLSALADHRRRAYWVPSV